jgi:dTDP-4-amino-4,6-dideoxygalactose transaminase
MGTSDEPFIVFGAPQILQEDIDAVVETLKTGWIGTGPRVAEFEKAVAAYKGVEHTAAVNSCTAALHLSMVAADLPKGSEVITTALTFCASVNAIIHAGLTPVLADVDPQTMNIDPKSVASKINSKTRAILPVHFAGRSCDMDALMKLANDKNLLMIEDCAHAIETTYKGKKAGTFGDYGCLSFYVTKNVVTGEGGMVITKKKENMDRIKILALHGMSRDAWKRFSDSGYKHYSVVECGYKDNLTDVAAALGLGSLRRVQPNWERRQQIWKKYQDAFKDLPLGLPAPVEPDTVHAYHLYTILVDEKKTGVSRDTFLEELTARKIGAGVHYLSIPEHPFYQKTFGWKPEDFPNAMTIGRQTISLPLSPRLTDGEADRVIAAVRSILTA